MVKTRRDFGERARVLSGDASDIANIPEDGVRVVALGEGDMTVVPTLNTNGETVAFVGVQAGFIPPFFVRRVTVAPAAGFATIED